MIKRVFSFTLNLSLSTGFPRVGPTGCESLNTISELSGPLLMEPSEVRRHLCVARAKPARLAAYMGQFYWIKPDTGQLGWGFRRPDAGGRPAPTRQLAGKIYCCHFSGRRDSLQPLHAERGASSRADKSGPILVEKNY